VRLRTEKGSYFVEQATEAYSSGAVFDLAHRSMPMFDPAMILLESIIEIATTAVDALPGYLRDGARPRTDGSRVTVRVEVPLLFPGLSVDQLTIARSAELPRG
jgi:hypothetical protein